MAALQSLILSFYDLNNEPPSYDYFTSIRYLKYLKKQQLKPPEPHVLKLHPAASLIPPITTHNTKSQHTQHLHPVRSDNEGSIPNQGPTRVPTEAIAQLKVEASRVVTELV